MSLKEVFSRLRFQNLALARYYCTKSDKILETAEESPVFLEDKKDTDEIEMKRNKSRLNMQDRNRLNDRNPYDQPLAWYHNTIRYKKRVLGRYGLKAVGVPAGFVWPSLEEVEDMMEFERVSYSPDIHGRLQKIKDEKNRKEEAMMARQEKIAEKMANMKQMIAEVQEKMAKKQQAEFEAKLRKERKIEEIRKKLIAEGSMSKEKLAEALTVAEKDEKKMKKEAKKAKMLEWQKKIAERLTQQHLQDLEGGNPEEGEDAKDSKKD